MCKHARALLGYTLPQIVLMAVVGVAVAWLASFLENMVVVAVLPGLVGARNHLSSHSEAAWEITENGTRELWNDGPKPSVKGGVLIDRQ